MKTTEKINNLIRAGIPCELAETVVEKGFSLSKVKETPKSELSKYFNQAEVTILFDLKRKPISQDIVDKLFTESAARCCLCWQWDEQPPLIIHHIEEHSKTQDDSYENLVLLCLNHHAEVHTIHKLSRHKKPPNFVRSEKDKWIHAVTEYQAGRRPKPGTEKTKRIYKPAAPPADLHFVGREKALKQITNKLKRERASILAISGMGGIGKTALAKKVVEQVSKNYSGGIFWASLSEVNGEATPIFLTWASMCGIESFDDQDVADFAYLMRNILTTYVAEHGRILIVIDDVREEWLSMAKLLQNAAPQNCSILITTRSKEIAKTLNAQLVNLGEMLPNEAIELLNRLIDLSLFEQEMLSIENLLDILGYLPLAIELAGKRISLEHNKPGFSLGMFLEAIRSRAATKLMVKGHLGLTATFLITYDNLQPQDQAVFRQTSIFATNLFSIDQAAAITHIELGIIETILDDMVMQSLLQWGSTKGDYVFHPLLKQFATQLFSKLPHEQDKIQNRYVDYFINHAADNAKETSNAHQVLDRMWPDIQQAFGIAVKQKNNVGVNRFANILWRDSSFLYVRSYVHEAVHILKEAIDACRQSDLKEDEVGHLIHIGTAYNHLGDTEKALHFYHEALNLNRHLQQPYIDGVCLNNLGLIYYDIGRLDQALNCFIQALHIAKEYNDPYLTADVYGSLGSIQRTLGNIEEAKHYYNGNLELAKILDDKLQEGNALSNLGLTYYDERDYKTARKYINRGLKIAREIGDRRGEANRLGHLGNICDLTGKPEKAIVYFSEAVEICRAISHRINEGNWLGNMGNSYRMLGKPDKAIELFKQALDISRDVQSNKQEIIWLLNLGRTFRQMKKWDHSISCFEDAAKVSKTLGDYEQYQVAMNDLVNIYKHLGKVNELNNCYKKQLQASQGVGDLETTGKLLNLIGVSLLYSGQLDQSKMYFQEGLVVSKQLQDKTLEGDCLNNLALNAKHVSDFDEAIELYQQAISCFKEAGNKSGEGISIGELGAVYMSLGQIDKAIDSLNKAYAIFQSTQLFIKYGFALGNLGNAYYIKGDLEKAVKYHEQALEVSQSLQDSLNVANWSGALGQDHLNLGNYEKAEEFYSQCLLFSQKNGIPFLEANCLLGLGVIYRTLSQKKLSDQNLQKALTLSRKLDDKVLQAGCLFQIGINLAEKAKFNKARINFEKSLQIFRQYRSRFREAMVLWELGKLYEIEEPEKAVQFMNDALLIFEECGIPRDQEYMTKLNEVNDKLAN